MGCNSLWFGYSIHKYKEISDFYVGLEIKTLDRSYKLLFDVWKGMILLYVWTKFGTLTINTSRDI